MSLKTLLMIKPDGVRRGLIGEVLRRVEQKGFRIAGMKMLQFDEARAGEFYQEHIGKPFYQTLVDFITSGPAVALAVEGDDEERLIPEVRKMMGATRYWEATPGTIRGDFAHHLTMNVVHGSDSPASAERELGIVFEPNEIL
ncbi:nucleoside-diphosphate kinase [Candidatus Sumerlaeota bacterium]|nr:nucleoside-diphosphate kinase [Candidatus Sumerlaeota bacterium]